MPTTTGQDTRSLLSQDTCSLLSQDTGSLLSGCGFLQGVPDEDCHHQTYCELMKCMRGMEYVSTEVWVYVEWNMGARRYGCMWNGIWEYCIEYEGMTVCVQDDGWRRRRRSRGNYQHSIYRVSSPSPSLPLSSDGESVDVHTQFLVSESLCCESPAVPYLTLPLPLSLSLCQAFSELSCAHSVILTSGTLSPLSSFSSGLYLTPLTPLHFPLPLQS